MATFSRSSSASRCRAPSVNRLRPSRAAAALCRLRALSCRQRGIGVKIGSMPCAAWHSARSPHSKMPVRLLHAKAPALLWRGHAMPLPRAASRTAQHTVRGTSAHHAQAGKHLSIHTATEALCQLCSTIHLLLQNAATWH